MLGVGLLAAAALGVSAGFAQVVILKASGPSSAEYSAGRVLASTKAIHLKAGDRLSIKVGDETRTVVGPGDVTVDTPRSTLETLRALLTANKSGYQVFTASRGNSGFDPVQGNLWALDVSTTSTFCIAPDAQPSMVRWSAGQEAKVEITPAGGAGRPMVVTWPRDQTSLPWPESLSTADGSAYDLRVGDKDPVTVTWRRVNGPSDGVTAFARELTDHGCDQQVDTLMASLPS